MTVQIQKKLALFMTGIGATWLLSPSPAVAAWHSFLAEPVSMATLDLVLGGASCLFPLNSFVMTIYAATQFGSPEASVPFSGFSLALKNSLAGIALLGFIYWLTGAWGNILTFSLILNILMIVIELIMVSLLVPSLLGQRHDQQRISVKRIGKEKQP